MTKAFRAQLILIVALGMAAPSMFLVAAVTGRFEWLEQTLLLSFSPLPLVFDSPEYFGTSEIRIVYEKSAPEVVSPEASQIYFLPWHFALNMIQPLMLPTLFAPCDMEAKTLSYFYCNASSLHAPPAGDRVKSVTHVWTGFPGVTEARREKRVDCR